MAWDSSRPVPWDNLIRSWLVYVAIMAVVFTVLFRDQSLIGVFGGLLISGPLYLAFGYVLAKFGYQRKSWKEMRAERETRASTPKATSSSNADDSGVRAKPAPTKRTGGGSGRPTSSKKRRR